MKKILRCCCVALCLALPIVWAGCTSTPTRESTGEYVDDSVITTKVKAELAGDTVMSLFKVGVETYKGVVQLSGFVNTQEQADRAATLSKRIVGVREVKNSLIVKPQ
jgi:osmotically-inducible protein OsmY